MRAWKRGFDRRRIAVFDFASETQAGREFFRRITTVFGSFILRRCAFSFSLRMPAIDNSVGIAFSFFLFRLCVGAVECIYACTAVFLCCYRFFSVNKDLYKMITFNAVGA